MGLCFFIIFCDRLCFKQNIDKRGNFDISNANLASTVLVCTTPLLLPKIFDILIIPNRIGKYSTPGMNSYQEKLSPEGISKQFNSHYKLSWCKWDGWRDDRRQVDPIRYPLKNTHKFLTECIQEGNDYNAIAGFRYAQLVCTTSPDDS